MTFEYRIKLNGGTVGEKCVTIGKIEDKILYTSSLHQIEKSEEIQLILDTEFYVQEAIVKTSTGIHENILKLSDLGLLINQKFYFDDVLAFSLPKIYKENRINYLSMSANQLNLFYMKVARKSEDKFNILLPEYSYLSYCEKTKFLKYYENLFTGLTIEKLY